MKLFFLVFHTLLHKHVNLFELVPRLPCMHQVREDVRARFLCKSMKLGSQAGLVVQVHLARRLRLLYPLAGERVLKSSQTKSAHASQHKHPTGKAQHTSPFRLLSYQCQTGRISSFPF